VEITMRKILALAITSLLCSTAFAAGEIYRWKDANGLWHYSDQPRPGAEIVRTLQRPPGSATGAVPYTAPTPPPAPLTATGDAPQVSGEVAQQVRQEAADAKAKQCELAKANYEKSIQAQRIYKNDEKGNRVFLTAAEMDAARLTARSNRDQLCGT
jgi:Domain of unknown function (DUF4124)